MILSIVPTVALGRRKKQTDTMRRTQRIALDLFESDGFDAVTVNDIASAAGIAASTVYRHFETKEAIVLWDEHDAEIDRAIEAQLRADRPPLDAIRAAFIESLAARYDESDAFQLRRVRYVYATEQVHAAAVEDDLRNRAELADGLAYFLPKKRRSSAPIIAGVAMVAVDVAIDRWQQANGSRTLASCIGEAFDQLDDMLGDTAT